VKFEPSSFVVCRAMIGLWYSRRADGGWRSMITRW
jgi:hypothetical protein